jgi:hypothetical protein
VSDRTLIFPYDALVALMCVPEAARLEIGVVVQNGAPSVVARVSVEVGRHDWLVGKRALF